MSVGGRGIPFQSLFNVGVGGAVDRTVYSKLHDWISVADYGAVGDGIANDEVPVLAAIAAAAGTQLLIFPFPGPYKTTTYGIITGGVYYPPLSATGATLRSIPKKLFDDVSALDFGADPAGLADSTTAFQNMINYISTTGAVGTLPVGNYAVTSINISTGTGFTLLGQGATVTTSNEAAFIFTGTSANVTFSGINFVSTFVSTSGVSGIIRSFNQNLTNIRVLNCTFTCPTGATEGVKIDTTNASPGLVGLEVSGCSFVNCGQMGVEIINHTGDQTLSRYEQVRVVNNRFDSMGLVANYGSAVSFSGHGQNLEFSGNTCSNCMTNIIEMVSVHNCVVSNNVVQKMRVGGIQAPVGIYLGTGLGSSGGLTFVGNSVDSTGAGSTSYCMQYDSGSDGLIAGNLLIGDGKFSVAGTNIVLTGNMIDVTNTILITGSSYLAASGNVFQCRTNTAGYNPTITNTTFSQFSGNTFYSERSTGLLINGTTTDNVFASCVFSNINSPAAGPPLQFDGANVTRNLIVGANLQRTAAGGTTWSQTNTAAGNQVGVTIANTVSPNGADKYAFPISLPQGGNNWLQAIQVGGAYFFQDGNTNLRTNAGVPNNQYDGIIMGTRRITATYGANVAIDAGKGTEYVITANNNTAFQINNPTNAISGNKITIMVRNTAGVPLGAVTWDTLYKLSAWTSPATANSRSIEFVYDGSNWVQLWQSAVDVPN